jgi:hypothetical protein
MAKLSSKNALVMVGGYALAPNAFSYSVEGPMVETIDVTGFAEGSQNFTPGASAGKVTCNFYWNNDAGATNLALKTPGARVVTIMPEGYTLGTNALSLNAISNSFNAAGEAQGSPITVQSVEFNAYSNYYSVMGGWMLAHQSITNTTTTTGVLDPSNAAASAVCAASLHVWALCAADTYAIKVQHSSDDSSYSDLLSFTLNGSALGAEVVKVASGTVNKYRRVVATRTGAAGNTLSFSVFFWHA